MRLVTQKNTHLGEILQSYCIAILEEVVGNLGKDLTPEPNGDASAKVGFPGEYGASYLYLGFDNRGFLMCQFLKELSSGRPSTVYGPIALAKSVNMPIGIIAQRITQALPKGL